MVKNINSVFIGSKNPTKINAVKKAFASVFKKKHFSRDLVVVIMGFVCLLFAFIGVHIVTDSVHGYLLVGGGG